MTYPDAVSEDVICKAILDVVEENENSTGFVFGFWVPALVEDKLGGRRNIVVSTDQVHGWLWELINDGRLDIDSQGKVTRGAKAADEAGAGHPGLREPYVETARVERECDPRRDGHGVCCLLPGTSPSS